MTRIAELQLELDELIPLMLDKGLVKPEAKASIEANSRGGVLLTWYWRQAQPGEPWDDKNFASRWFFASDDRPDGRGPWGGAVWDARQELLALPGKAEREREEFLKLLAKATEYGRQVGIEEEFVNPLQVLAKKLSENALTPPTDVIRLHISDEARHGLDSPVRPMPDDETPY